MAAKPISNYIPTALIALNTLLVAENWYLRPQSAGAWFVVLLVLIGMTLALVLSREPEEEGSAPRCREFGPKRDRHSRSDSRDFAWRETCHGARRGPLRRYRATRDDGDRGRLPGRDRERHTENPHAVGGAALRPREGSGRPTSRRLDLGAGGSRGCDCMAHAADQSGRGDVLPLAAERHPRHRRASGLAATGEAERTLKPRRDERETMFASVLGSSYAIVRGSRFSRRVQIRPRNHESLSVQQVA